jgi:hypothetical protein
MCPGCETQGMRVFYAVDGVPVNSCIQLETAEAAKNYPTGKIRLAFCDTCGFVNNIAFDPGMAEYSARYEETQGFSPTFNAFHEDLAKRLIERHDLHRKRIIEIGCGKGEFLDLLCALGENNGIGFDPGHDPARNRPQRPDLVRFVEDFYSEKYADERGDFVCCKMTLEHIYPTREFMGVVRASIGDASDTTVYFLVPDATRIFRECAFEDIYYEHCSYFTRQSLGALFARAGFDVIGMDSEYDGQYLSIEARAAAGETRTTPQFDAKGAEAALVREDVEEFVAKLSSLQETWQRRVRETVNAGGEVVLWGSGSKAVSFLTTLDLGDAVERVVDINPYRQGHFMPRTAQPIVAPEALRDRAPDLVIVMNRIYTGEITAQIESLGIAPEIAAL